MNKNKLFLILLFSIFFINFISAQGMIEENAVKIKDPLESNGAIPVNIQDQETRPFDTRVNQIISSSYSLTVSPTVDSYNLTLNTTTGLIVGDTIAFIEQNGIAQIYFGEIEAINGNVITMDSPVPFNFTPSATSVFEFDNNLNKDGSITTQVFGLTNFFDESLDITRFLFHCTDDSPMDDGTFCGGNELTRGMVLRKKLTNGNYINYWTIRTNGQWGELAYDKTYDAKAPSGLYGMTVRLTYAGQEKHGVVIRLEPNESIELLVQDDLTAITSAKLMVEGHFVQD